MAQFKLSAGASIDLLTKDEVSDALRSWADEREIAQLRGIKYMRQTTSFPSTPTTAKLTGPDLGYAWNLKMVTGTLTGLDSVAVYIGDYASPRLIGYSPAPSGTTAQNLFVITWSSDQVVLQPGEGLYLATSGAFRFTQVMTTAVQVPAELLGKVLG